MLRKAASLIESLQPCDLGQGVLSPRGFGTNEQRIERPSGQWRPLSWRLAAHRWPLRRLRIES